MGSGTATTACSRATGSAAFPSHRGPLRQTATFRIELPRLVVAAGSQFAGAAPGSQFAGAASGNQFAGATPGNQFAGAASGNQFAGAASGNQFAGATPGNQFAGAASGNQFAGATAVASTCQLAGTVAAVAEPANTVTAAPAAATAAAHRVIFKVPPETSMDPNSHPPDCAAPAGLSLAPGVRQFWLCVDTCPEPADAALAIAGRATRIGVIRTRSPLAFRPGSVALILDRGQSTQVPGRRVLPQADSDHAESW
jgi:hypothetical protein